MRLAVIGPTRRALEGVAAGLAQGPVATAGEVRTFDSAGALHTQGPWPELAVALVRTEADVRDVLDALADEVPVLWLLEPGAPFASLAACAAARSGPRTAGWLPADSGPERWHAAIGALALGLSVHDAGLALHPPRPDAAPETMLQDPLTARELEVFEFMAKGLANREIARVLGISAHTAKFHVAQILAKTGTATRTEAVAFALKRGLVGV